MMRLNKQLFISCLLVLMLMAPGVSLAVDVGGPAPDFSLQTLDEQTVSLADFKGRVVLVKLATTWCPTCKQLSAEIAKIGDYLKEQDVAVLEVFVQDSPEMVARYLDDKKFPMTFHALLDDGQAYQSYNVYLIPRLVVVNPQGLVTYDSAGQSVSADDLKKLVAEAQKPAVK